SPWVKYQRVLEEDQGGPSTVAFRKDSTFPIVVVKSYLATDSSKVQDVFRTRHPNIVNVLDAFYEDDTTYIVYEYMTRSIAEVQATPLGKFEEFEIAAICKEVIEGLLFLHDLDIIHGSFTSSIVLLNREGNVKIANIGESVLISSPISKGIDIQALGRFILQLMEPSSILQQTSTLSLKYPEYWSITSKEFLSQVKSEALISLKNHNFLQMSPGPACLKPHVLVAERAVRPNWKI
ncbi:kinase-like protein, partial [Mytilinidion resinicola]